MTARAHELTVLVAVATDDGLPDSLPGARDGHNPQHNPAQQSHKMQEGEKGADRTEVAVRPP